MEMIERRRGVRIEANSASDKDSRDALKVCSCY